MDWTWDEISETWKCGTQNVGAGVYRDDPLPGDDMEWYGNVCRGGEIVMIGPFRYCDAAQLCAERLLRECQEKNNDHDS